MTASVDRDTYYASLGVLYDDLKATDNLERLAELIDSVTCLRQTGRRLLDMGCGTGSSTKAFADRGYQVVGCDKSPEMLEVARRTHPQLQFVMADICDLPTTLRGFDRINYTGDVPNHLLHPSAFTASLTCAARALEPGGLVTFDVTTLESYHLLFGATHAIEREDAHFTWIGRSPDMKPDQQADLAVVAFRQRNGLWERTDATLRQRHYSESTIARCISLAGLDLVEVYGLTAGTLTRSRSEFGHVKLVYVAQAAS